ncbi:Stomatin-like protein 2, mitochondrial [Thelohanellus kitauei]|uniref:Stomatin-like protein 2, mitochondrial n=1 Tax=Thelohanellus kitauei TaxID=669202 RepID=A0A0C2NLL9_THEKT|nr:Stomatin-like protein 2, mitochondrial [Thelohanellus kitauei]
MQSLILWRNRLAFILMKYIEAFEKLAKETNTVILPKNISDIGSCIAESMAIYQTLSKKSDGIQGGGSSGAAPLTKDETTAVKENKTSLKPRQKTDEFKLDQMFPSTWKMKMI